MDEMPRIEYYQAMEAKFRHEAESESDPTIRERILTQADGWHLLATASRYISEKQADTQELPAAMDKRLPHREV
jgi:hypothetical protein